MKNDFEEEIFDMFCREAAENNELIDKEKLAQAYEKLYEQVQDFVVREKQPELEKSLVENDSSIIQLVVENFIRLHHPSFYRGDRNLLKKTAEAIVADMTGFSFLNKYFRMQDRIEEININAWNNIRVLWVGGRSELIEEHFLSPEHARDILVRILRMSGQYIDENRIRVTTNIGKSIRIAAAIYPLVDEAVYVTASIRFVHSAIYTMDELIKKKLATEEMGEFLSLCMNNGISTCYCGETGSGKTTLLNAVLQTVPDSKRIITMEAGTREFDLQRNDENGRPVNDVIHFQTRPSLSAEYNINLESLLDLVLRYHPDIVIVGEMLSEESFLASETARTGHTVASTLHCKNAFDAYYRMYSLGIRKYNLKEEVMMKFMVDAFPIIIYTKMYEDGVRRIQSILEAWYEDGKPKYNELYHFDVENNLTIGGRTKVIGSFRKCHNISKRIRDTLLDFGASSEMIERFNSPELEVSSGEEYSSAMA